MEAHATNATPTTKMLMDAHLLIDASKYNECERLQSEIRNGIDVNSHDADGWTVSC